MSEIEIRYDWTVFELLPDKNQEEVSRWFDQRGFRSGSYNLYSRVHTRHMNGIRWAQLRALLKEPGCPVIYPAPQESIEPLPDWSEDWLV